MPPSPLDALWIALRPPAAPPSEWSALWDELRERYSEPHRHYHTVRHLEEMAAILERERARLHDSKAVGLAMSFHDAVLAPTASDNEARSAELARERLRPWFEPEVLERVEALVLATRGHDVDPSDTDRALLVDADLAILGAPAERYREYARAIREEYRRVPALLYRQGRRRFLRAMLARPAIFTDERIAAEREERARANIEAELAGEFD